MKSRDKIGERLLTQEAVDRHLKRLLKRDPRLRAVAREAGTFPPRSRPAGFAGLARIVCGQQVSVASASAIWARLEALPGGMTTEAFSLLTEETTRAVGLSRSKHRTIRALAEILESGGLNLTDLEQRPAEEAIAELSKLPGIGPWTAEVYLMFCAGHPDVFPAGDIALQRAASEAFERKIDQLELRKISTVWAPHRATAALLLWRFYAIRRHRTLVIPA